MIDDSLVQSLEKFGVSAKLKNLSLQTGLLNSFHQKLGQGEGLEVQQVALGVSHHQVDVAHQLQRN